MSTNYLNTFIAVAADCPATAPVVPPFNAAKPTVAGLQFQLLTEHPYGFTSDDLLFAVHALRAGIPDHAMAAERDEFLARAQACLRASPLGKRYGWGTHHDGHGRVALYGLGTAEYERLAHLPELTHKSAMRSSRA